MDVENPKPLLYSGPAPASSAPTARPMTDAELLDRFVQQRDAAAFEGLVRRHGPMVLRVCQRVLHQSQDAEDAFQATFIVLMQKAAQIARRELLANWLFGVAQRVALKARCALGKRRTRGELTGDVLAGSLPAPADDAGLMLHEELNRLPEKYRAPLVLCYLQGKTTNEAAQELGWPISTVAGRLPRAKEILRDRLARRGLTLSAGALAVILAQESAAAAVPPSLVATTMQGMQLAATGKTTAAGTLAAQAIAEESPALASACPWLKSRVWMIVLLGGIGMGAWWYIPRPAATWTQVATIQGHTALITEVKFSPDGKTLVSAGQDGKVTFWDAAIWKELYSIPLARGASRFMEFAPDGTTLVIETLGVPEAKERALVLWDIECRLGRYAIPKGGNNPPYSGKEITARRLWRVLPDGNLMIGTNTGYEIRRKIGTRAGYDIRSMNGRLLQVFPPPARAVAAAQLSDDGRLLVFQSPDREKGGYHVCLYGLQSKEEKIVGHVTELAPLTSISPDGQSVALVEKFPRDHECKLLDGTTGREHARLALTTSGNGQINRVRFSPDGKLLALAGSVDSHAAVRVFDGTSGRLLATLDGQTGSPSGPNKGCLGCAFSPDGRKIAMGQMNGTISVWELRE